MPVRILRLERGDTLALPGGEGRRGLWRVERRVREGYVLSSKAGDADRLWTNDEIFDAYVAGAMEHWPCNLLGLDQALADMLQSEIENWSPRKIFEATCREAYVARADVLRARGVPAKTAYRRAARVVFRARRTDWARQAERIDAVEQEQRDARRRKPKPTALGAAAAVVPFELGEFSVRNWYIVWEKCGRDLRALIAKTHLRGQHGRRYPCRLDEQQDEREPLCVYGAMAWVARSVYMQIPRVTKTYAYGRLEGLCRQGGYDVVSDTTFFTFLREHYTEFEEFRARHGPRAAYLKFHIFERRALPERALEEVEVDHCLLDVFVTDSKGRTARPWLTVLICRATKMIIGIHISFEVPSYVSLSRAIIHAMSPKDLTGIPGIENDWPCHGVFDMLITDRGLEFLSESLMRAGRDLRFAIVNLPGRMPHLKGTVERFFGTLGVRVLTHMEGTTLSRTPQYYDPQARARFTLQELTARIVKWIVDDYHVSKHDTLGMPPIQRWRQLVEEAADGGVRAVGSFSRLVMLMGERVRRKVSNVGIHYDGHLYASYELAEMRRRRGGLDNVEILADVTDRGHLWVLDKLNGWIVVPAVNQRIAGGLNKFAARVVARMARRLAGRGEEVTDEIMERARALCDEQAATAGSRAAIRYCSDGALATDVMGNASILPVLGGSWMPGVEDAVAWTELSIPSGGTVDEPSAGVPIDDDAGGETGPVTPIGQDSPAAEALTVKTPSSEEAPKGIDLLRSLVQRRASGVRTFT